MGDVIELGPHTNMTAKECLASVARNSDEYQGVLVLGYDQDGDLTIRSSHMTLAEANFMLDVAKIKVLEELLV